MYELFDRWWMVLMLFSDFLALIFREISAKFNSYAVS